MRLMEFVEVSSNREIWKLGEMTTQELNLNVGAFKRLAELLACTKVGGESCEREGEE